MYLNCNICKHVIVDKFAAQMSLATALSERRFRYTLLPLLNTLYILKNLDISNNTWSSSSASHNVIPKSVWLSLSGMNALAGWGCRNNFRKKILHFILTSFTFLLLDVACHILIFSFRHYFAMHFLFRQSSLLHGGDLPFLKLIHEVNSTSFLQTVNNTIQ